MSLESKRRWFANHRQINAWVSISDFDRLRMIADGEGVSVSSVAREALTDYLDATSRRARSANVEVREVEG